MNRKIFKVFLLFILGFLPFSEASMTNEQLSGYDFYLDADKTVRLNKLKKEEFAIYLLNERKNITKDSSSLEKYMLMIKVVPMDSKAVYMTFPDGGNMLLILDDKIDVKELTDFLEDTLSSSKKEAYFMKIIGWKPRIDWLLLSKSIAVDDAAILNLVKRYDIKEILSPDGAEYDKRPAIRHSKLDFDTNIDLLQTIAPLKMTVVTQKKSQTDSVILNLKYHEFSFLFIPDLKNSYFRKITNESPDVLDSTVIFAPKLSETLNKSSNSSFFIPLSSKLSLTTDGQLIYISGDKK